MILGNDKEQNELSFETHLIGYKISFRIGNSCSGNYITVVPIHRLVCKIVADPFEFAGWIIKTLKL